MLGCVGGEARDGAGLVVVLKEDGCPAIVAADQILCASNRLLEGGQNPVARCGLELVWALADVHNIKLEDHVELLLLCGNVLEDSGHVLRVGAFTDGHGIVFAEDFIHLTKELSHPGSVAVLVASKLPFGSRVCDGSIEHLALAVHVDSVNAETVNTTLEPELHGGLVDSFACLLVLPVQVGLLWAEQMEVVLLCVFVPFPDTACEVGNPVVGRLAFTVDIASWAPDVPVTLGVVLGRARLKEPLVLVTVSTR